MVPVEVLNELDNLTLKSMDDGLDLIASREKLNHLLEGTSSVLIKSNVNQARRCSVNKDSTLIVVSEFEKLLTEVIAKGI